MPTLAGLREAMPDKCGSPLFVVDERKRGACRRVGQDLVEQVQVVRTPLLERELLYRCDDLRRQSHRRIMGRERLVPDPNFSSG